MSVNCSDDDRAQQANYNNVVNLLSQNGIKVLNCSASTISEVVNNNHAGNHQAALDPVDLTLIIILLCIILAILVLSFFSCRKSSTVKDGATQTNDVMVLDPFGREEETEVAATIIVEGNEDEEVQEILDDETVVYFETHTCDENCFRHPFQLLLDGYNSDSDFWLSGELGLEHERYFSRNMSLPAVERRLAERSRLWEQTTLELLDPNFANEERIEMHLDDSSEGDVDEETEVEAAADHPFAVPETQSC